MSYKGKVHRFADDVNTDEIIPARYLNTTNKAELASHCMEDADKDFAKVVKPGDVIVAGRNFGCGSSREHAPIAIKAAGVSCVIADSFARIFSRNSINIGLPIVESPEASKDIKKGDTVSIDTVAGVIKNITRKKSYKFEKYPSFMQKIIKAGGLMAQIKKK
jgi:3-isopropylmalate dehydratase, small subunit